MGNLANNESEELAVINIAAFMVPVILAAAGAWLSAKSATAAAWLISHSIMVDPASALIPVTENAGLDLVRVIAITALACTIGFGYARFKPRKKAPAGRA